MILAILVIPKLMYGLESLWLRKVDTKRLDSFYVKCLRRVHGIKHAFWSRVSNLEVMATAGVQPLSRELLRRQLLLYGRFASQPDFAVQRKSFLESSTVHPRSWKGRRKRGRPRQEWGTEVHKHALNIAGSDADLRVCLYDPKRWKRAVSAYCQNPPEQAADGGAFSE